MKTTLILFLALLIPGTAMSAELYYCAETQGSGFSITKSGKYSPAKFRGRKFNLLLNKKRKNILVTWPYVFGAPAPIKSGDGLTELYACRAAIAYKVKLFDCHGAATTNFASLALNPSNGRFTRSMIFGNLVSPSSKGKWARDAEDAYVSHGQCSKVSGKK